MFSISIGINTEENSNLSDIDSSESDECNVSEKSSFFWKALSRNWPSPADPELSGNWPSPADPEHSGNWPSADPEHSGNWPSADPELSGNWPSPADPELSGNWPSPADPCTGDSAI